LYHAGVSPFSTANAIPEKEVTQIFNSIKNVLTTAIEKIGDANDDVLRGDLKDFMDIHSSGLKVTAKGETIKTEKIGGRTTYYTDQQQLFT
jgi:formamidopyrimidine-DNA glycosylase